MAHFACLYSSRVVDADLRPDVPSKVHSAHRSRAATFQDRPKLGFADVALVVEGHDQVAGIDAVHERFECAADPCPRVERAVVLPTVHTLARDPVDLGLVPTDQ